MRFVMFCAMCLLAVLCIVVNPMQIDARCGGGSSGRAGLFPRLHAIRANHVNRVSNRFQSRQAAPMSTIRVPQPLPVGPAAPAPVPAPKAKASADPFAPQNAAPAPAPVRATVRYEYMALPRNMTPSGMGWTKTGCNGQTCTWRRAVTIPQNPTHIDDSYVSASWCSACTCGCQQGGPCICASSR